MRKAILFAGMAWALPAFCQPVPEPSITRLDKGLLDPAWFGPGVAMAPGLGMDFVWVRPGTSLAGKRLQMAPWEFGPLLDPERATRDYMQAGFYTDRMPAYLSLFCRSLWGDSVQVGTEPGDFKLVGRIADSSNNGKGVGFGLGVLGMAVAQNLTWDLKILDAQGQVVAAIHNRWAVQGLGDPFRFLFREKHYRGLQAFFGSLAPAAKMAEVAQIPFDGDANPLPNKMSYGSTPALELKGKTLLVEPWTIRDEGLGPKAWEYVICAEQCQNLAKAAFAPVAPAPGVEPDFVLRGVLRANRGDILYQATLFDANGKAVFRASQHRSDTVNEQMEGRDPFFIESVVALLAKPDKGFLLTTAPQVDPASLMPKEMSADQIKKGGTWLLPGLNLHGARIELGAWPKPALFTKGDDDLLRQAHSSARALPGLMAGMFIGASKGEVSVVTQEATHRLEGQLLKVGDKEIAVLEYRLVDLGKDRTVLAGKLLLKEGSSGRCQEGEALDQLASDKVQVYFQPGLFKALPAVVQSANTP